MLSLILIKSKTQGLYSRYYTDACNKWWGPSPSLSAWTTQFPSNSTAVSSRCRATKHYYNFALLHLKTVSATMHALNFLYNYQNEAGVRHTSSPLMLDLRGSCFPVPLNRCLHTSIIIVGCNTKQWE